MPDEKRQFEKEMLAQAQKELGNARSKLDVTFSEGEFNLDLQNLSAKPTGLRTDMLNVYVTDSKFTLAAGSDEAAALYGKHLITVVNAQANDRGLLMHGLAHHLLGHTFVAPKEPILRLVTNVIADTDVGMSRVGLKLYNMYDILRFRAGAELISTLEKASSKKP
jgi:hypothetical protein